MKIWRLLMSLKQRKTRASKQKEYRLILARKLHNRSFTELSDEEKREVLEVAAKDFSSKFSKDIEILAQE